MKRITVTNDLIPITLTVLVGRWSDAVAWMKRTHDVEWEDPRGASRASVWHRTKGQPGLESVIWMPYFRKGDAFDAGKLAHEALHIAWRLLAAYGCQDEETHCYMLQWIVHEVTERLTRSNRLEARR